MKNKQKKVLEKVRKLLVKIFKNEKFYCKENEVYIEKINKIHDSKEYREAMEGHYGKSKIRP